MNNNKKEKIALRLFNLMVKNPDGFTTDKDGNKLNLKSGFAVSLTNNKSKNPLLLLNKVLNDSEKYKSFNYGFWKDEKSNFNYLDISRIISKKHIALKTAKKYKQKAIFNFKDYKSIYL